VKLERNAQTWSRGVALDAWAMAGLLPATPVTPLHIIQLAVGADVTRRAS
jgi:hypothetical protein